MHLSESHIPISREYSFSYCVYWHAKIIMEKSKKLIQLNESVRLLSGLL